MATYSPTTRYRVVDFTAGQNQGDRAITTLSKTSIVTVQYTGGSANVRVTDGPSDEPSSYYATYYVVNGIENIISKTDTAKNSVSGIRSVGGVVPAGSEIRTGFQTSSGTANFRLHIIELD